MVRILVIRNGPVVLLSHLLKHLAGNDVELTVLTHAHAVGNVQALNHVDRVLSYEERDTFQYRKFGSELKEDLVLSQFDRVVFLINPDQTTGFENLLEIAQKVVRPHGEIVGMTSEGEQRIFPETVVRKTLADYRCQRWQAMAVCGALLLSFPFVAAFGAIRSLIWPQRSPT